MTKYAIVSDIHGNLEAQLAVERDISNREILLDNVICLGDIIGYGPQPWECVKRAQDYGHVIKGNHELGFESMKKGEMLDRYSARSVKIFEWMVGEFERYEEVKDFGFLERMGLAKSVGTGKRLPTELFEQEEARRKKEFYQTNYNFIKNLEVELRLDLGGINAYFVHGDPLRPRDLSAYVHDKTNAEKRGKVDETGRKLKNFTFPEEILTADKINGLAAAGWGHSHEPGIYFMDKSGKLQVRRSRLAKKNIIGVVGVNPGSAGKSIDKKAPYAVIDTEGDTFIEIIKLDYGWQTTERLLWELGLPALFKK